MAKVHGQGRWLVQEAPPDVNAEKDVPVLVEIDEMGRVSVNNFKLADASDRDLTKVSSRLREFVGENPHQIIDVIPLATTSYGRIEDVLKACQAAGVKNLFLGKWPHLPTGIAIP
jgi:biopolymer transport protein ExbD